MPCGRPIRRIAVALAAAASPVLTACVAAGGATGIPTWPVPRPAERAVAYGPEPAQVLDVYRPAHTVGRPVPARGTLVYVHGGSFMGGWRTQIAAANPEILGLTYLGYGVVSIDYRLLPEAGDITGEVGDVRRAIQWTRTHGRRHGLDTSEVVVVGQSSGGTLAALSAVTPAGPGRPDAWVSIAGVADIAAWATANHVVLPTTEILSSVSPLTAHAVPSVPGYVIHAEADPFVAVSQSRALVARARRAGQSVTFDEVASTPTCHPHSATCGMDGRAFVAWLGSVARGGSTAGRLVGGWPWAN